MSLHNPGRRDRCPRPAGLVPHHDDRTGLDEMRHSPYGALHPPFATPVTDTDFGHRFSAGWQASGRVMQGRPFARSRNAQFVPMVCTPKLGDPILRIIPASDVLGYRHSDGFRLLRRCLLFRDRATVAAGPCIGLLPHT
jgi:hypothetical protein